ncbi:hypothetical protein HMPREF1093_02873 [Hungatella hathewayi 12489931]|nr:hypothetical protein HMPREF1093_02873 [Hungatella hathewayi 12489931]
MMRIRPRSVFGLFFVAFGNGGGEVKLKWLDW